MGQVERVHNLEKETNVIKYRKPLNINIGVVIFVIIFIYVVFNVIMYFTETHVSPYEVEYGTMAANNIYDGFVIRDETVYTSEYKGAVNYYVREYSKVGFNDLIYSVDENGSVADKLNEAKQDVAQVSNSASGDIIELLDDFQLSYDSVDFYEVYALKEEVNSLLNEALSLDALAQISEYADTAEGNNTFHRVRTKEDGIISYYVDGYENVTVDSFEPAMLNKAAYQKENLKVNATVGTGDAVYKMINSEKWHVILPVSLELAQELREDNLIRIRFVKDSKEMYAEYEIREDNGSCYMVLSFKNAMIRYASERFLEVELLLAEEAGLKIPNSAIVEKEFYTIPVEYFLKGDDSSADGLLIEKTDREGKQTTEFIDPTIYYRTEEFCYIDSEYVQAGDRIIKPDSVDKYVIGDDTDTLQGVYNINKGYAVFKQIEVMLQNEEYSIIKTGTSYGVALYDHIALDGSKIQEDELIK
ncbi:MAG: hypothetical protein IKB01_07975 [Lachnospiraceae bacterium]|nr:hypothetical protein [Lachnospiraceae bacterium]